MNAQPFRTRVAVLRVAVAVAISYSVLMQLLAPGSLEDVLAGKMEGEPLDDGLGLEMATVVCISLVMAAVTLLIGHRVIRYLNLFAGLVCGLLAAFGMASNSWSEGSTGTSCWSRSAVSSHSWSPLYAWSTCGSRPPRRTPDVLLAPLRHVEPRLVLHRPRRLAGAPTRHLQARGSGRAGLDRRQIPHILRLGREPAPRTASDRRCRPKDGGLEDDRT